MVPSAEPPLVAGISAAPGRPPGYPFRGPALRARVAPFAVVMVLAEASLALPSAGRTSDWPGIASLLLLVATAAAFALPWPRLPVWMSVLVPLLATGWVLALLEAESGAHVGLAPIALMPALWTGLFHRWWESACVVAAIAAVQVADSLLQTAASAGVIVRRVILWILLSGLIVVAAHGLRDRIRRYQEQTTRLQERLRELTVLEDRDRIAANLQDKVIQPIFSAGLTLQGAAALAADPEVSQRIAASVGELDEVLRALRETIFGLERRFSNDGLRRQVLDLSGQLSPPPEVSFTGPVDGALPPASGAQLMEILRESLVLIKQQFVLVRIDVTAGDSSCVTVVDAVPLSPGRVMNGNGAAFSRLRESAARAGIRVGIEPGHNGTRFAWHVPLAPGASGAGELSRGPTSRYGRTVCPAQHPAPS